jgi:hypothetical protein
MSAILPTLAQEKELLLMRSALCRLRLRRSTRELRGSLDLGFGRATRVARIAGRVLVFAKLARSLIAFTRSRRA